MVLCCSADELTANTTPHYQTCNVYKALLLIWFYQQGYLCWFIASMNNTYRSICLLNFSAQQLEVYLVETFPLLHHALVIDVSAVGGDIHTISWLMQARQLISYQSYSYL